MIKCKGFVILKDHEKNYVVRRLAKLTDEPNTYIFQVRDPETKEESILKINGIGILEAIDSAVNVKNPSFSLM